MPGANYTVFKQMRPPVAIDGAGQSPIRTKKASEVFSMGEGNFQDRQGFKVTKEQIVKNQTDDGRLVDIDWNNRHHVNPSFYNSTNKSYYQEFFDKPFRRKRDIALVPRRQLDPYEENEVKGTRIPEYSKVSLDRDIFGELGWVPNFNVKKSKNNDDRHDNYREFFDAPKDYAVEFHTASQTNTEFYKMDQNAQESMSNMKSLKSHHSRAPSVQDSASFAQTRRSLNALERMSYSAVRDGAQSVHNTSFVLAPNQGNRHKIDTPLKDTVEMPNSIPFLRDTRNVDNPSYQKSICIDQPSVGSMPPRMSRKNSKDVEKRKVRELGWNKFNLPISALNEGVHASQRIPFEKI